MTDCFTLVHISDLHMTPVEGVAPRHWNVKRGLGLVNWVRSRRHVHSRLVAELMAEDIVHQAPDHVAVTGDLANLGLPSEYGSAREWLERLGTGATVSVVPGNHDIYSGAMSEAACVAAWRPYLASDEWGSAIVGDASHPFPYVRRKGPVALIGLNSAVPTRPFVAAGKLGRAQIDRLASVLARLAGESVARVVLIHHPPLPGLAPPRRALADARSLAEVLRRYGANLVLHGHNHADQVHWLESATGPAAVVGAPSGSAARAHGHEPPARYFLFRISNGREGIVIERTVRGLDAATGLVVEHSHARLTAPVTPR